MVILLLHYISFLLFGGCTRDEDICGRCGNTEEKVLLEGTEVHGGDGGVAKLY